MEDQEKYMTEDLLPGYFSGEISEEDRHEVDGWRDLSAENKKLFGEMSAIWETREILSQMEEFSAKEALKKLNSRLFVDHKRAMFRQRLQRIAAILLFPVLIYAGVVTFNRPGKSDAVPGPVIRQKIKTTTGTIAELSLPDSTRVWLNHGTTLEYPMVFGKNREVKLSGEAYFEVKEDKTHPFIVYTGVIGIEVLGTSFNATNYPDEDQTSVVLTEGSVQLIAGKAEDRRVVASLKPNQKATFNRVSRKLSVNTVYAGEYTAWKDGILMFADDPMEEVAGKLSRWFNVDIELRTNELYNYVYKATFKDESLIQVLDLLKLSAPIEYSVKPGEPLPNGGYSKQKVIIRRR